MTSKKQLLVHSFERTDSRCLLLSRTLHIDTKKDMGLIQGHDGTNNFYLSSLVRWDHDKSVGMIRQTGETMSSRVAAREHNNGHRESQLESITMVIKSRSSLGG